MIFRCAALIASVAVALAGCGGASSSPSAGTAGPAHTATFTTRSGARLVPTIGGSGGQAGPARDVVHRSGEVVIAHGHDSEPSAGPQRPLDPCTLVTTQEVAAIIRQPVAKAVKAIQGPTCVYVPRAAPPSGAPAPGRRRAQVHGIEVTLSVTPMNFKDSRAGLGNAIAFKVSGHDAYCGVIGHPVAYVSLAYGRVMTIAAPCPLAALIAKTALTRL